MPTQPTGRYLKGSIPRTASDTDRALQVHWLQLFVFALEAPKGASAAMSELWSRRQHCEK